MVRLAQKICIQPFSIARALLFFLLFSFSILKFADASQLTINNIDWGSGSISGDIGCSLGPKQGCLPVTFTDGSLVTLAAASDWKSIFTGWGLPCSSTGTCSITPSADTVLEVSFAKKLQARLGFGAHNDPQYDSLTEAYAGAGNTSGQYINAHQGPFQESLILNKNIAINLQGGRDGTDYLTTKDSFGTLLLTTLVGTLDVQLGSIRVDSMIIRDLLVEQGSIEVNSLIIQ